jgi:hypothetical protein
MKARVNTFALQQSCLQSSALGVLGSIAHPIGKPGEFTGRVMQGRVQVAEFSLHADPDVAATQATIDLARIAGPSLVGQPYKVHKYSVNSDGYLMLFVSEGPGEFWVQLSSPGKDRPRVVFDSRRLKPGDLFIATLIRPGTHQARMPKGVAAIRVRAPEASDKPFQPPPPAGMTCTKTGFVPKRLEVYSTQGIVFNFETTSGVQIDLTKPAATRGAKSLRSARWRGRPDNRR